MHTLAPLPASTKRLKILRATDWKQLQGHLKTRDLLPPLMLRLVCHAHTAALRIRFKNPLRQLASGAATSPRPRQRELHAQKNEYRSSHPIEPC